MIRRESQRHPDCLKPVPVGVQCDERTVLKAADDRDVIGHAFNRGPGFLGRCGLDVTLHRVVARSHDGKPRDAHARAPSTTNIQLTLAMVTEAFIAAIVVTTPWDALLECKLATR